MHIFFFKWLPYPQSSMEGHVVVAYYVTVSSTCCTFAISPKPHSTCMTYTLLPASILQMGRVREINKGGHLLTIYDLSSTGLIALNEFACFILTRL